LGFHPLICGLNLFRRKDKIAIFVAFRVPILVDQGIDIICSRRFCRRKTGSLICINVQTDPIDDDSY